MPLFRATIHGDRPAHHARQRGKPDVAETGPVEAEGIIEAAAEMLDQWFAMRQREAGFLRWEQVVLEVREIDEEVASPPQPPSLAIVVQTGWYVVVVTYPDLLPDPSDGADEALAPSELAVRAETPGEAIREHADQLRDPDARHLDITVKRAEEQ